MIGLAQVAWSAAALPARALSPPSPVCTPSTVRNAVGVLPGTLLAGYRLGQSNQSMAKHIRITRLLPFSRLHDPVVDSGPNRKAVLGGATVQAPGKPPQVFDGAEWRR